MLFSVPSLSFNQDEFLVFHRCKFLNFDGIKVEIVNSLVNHGNVYRILALVPVLMAFSWCIAWLEF